MVAARTLLIIHSKSTPEIDSPKCPDGLLEVADRFCYPGNVTGQGAECSEVKQPKQEQTGETSTSYCHY